MKLTILINIEITVVLKQHKESVNAKRIKIHSKPKQKLIINEN